MKPSASKRRNQAVWTVAVVAVAALTLRSHAQNVVAWGSNSYGQTNVPASASNVITVAAGWYHSLALRADGTIVAWGRNNEGQTNVPAGLSNAVAMAAGGNHSLALQGDGTVLAWGDNGFGQTNVPLSATNVVALAAGYYHSLALRADGTVIAWGKNSYGQTNVPTALGTVIAVSAGAEHSMVLQDDAFVVIWGGSSSYPLSGARRVPATVNKSRDVTSISAGASHNLFLRATGRVTDSGYITYQTSLPSWATNLVEVAAGTNFNLGLTASGTVVAWGNGSVTNVPVSATNTISIAAGLAHGLAVKGDGVPRILGRAGYRVVASAGDSLPLAVRGLGKPPLYYQWLADGTPILDATNPLPKVFGFPSRGNLAYQVMVSNALGGALSGPVRFTIHPLNVWGDDTQWQRMVPVAATNAGAIAAGAFHSAALNLDGSVVAWGKNADGQTNLAVAATNLVAVAAGSDHTLALRSDGTVVAWGRNWDGQTNVPPHATNVVAVAAGWAHSLVLKADGTVAAWGNNTHGQTAVSFLASDVVAIAAGYYHSLALRSDGLVVGWGGLHSVPSSATNMVAIAAGWGHSLGLRANGTVLAWGDNTYGQTNVPVSATNVIAIGAGWCHSLALKADGTVVAWGKGYFGMTNTPANFREVAAIAAGEDHSIALAIWGPPQVTRQLASVAASQGGQLILSPNVVGTLPLAFQWFREGVPILGATNRFLLLPNADSADSGAYVLVVTNAFGQASSEPITVTVDPNPVTLTAVGAWGDNVVNQCDIPPGLREPRAIAAGNFHNLAAQADGTVVALGKNADGQTNVPLEATNVVTVAAGGDHSLALRSDASVLAWGRNWDGQANVPSQATNVVAIAAGWAHSVILTGDGNVLAWGNNQYRQTSVPTLATNIIRIAAGYYHTLALRSDRRVVSWGSQHAVPASVTNVVDIAAGWEHSLALRSDGTVVAWGDNSYGQTNVPPSATNVVAIAAGYGHSWALRSDGKLLGWGTRYYGVTNAPAGIRNLASIAAGENHFLALVESGRPRFRQEFQSTTAHVGGCAVFTADLAGSRPLAFQWYHDGAPIPGATNRALTLQGVQTNHAGSYVLVASNSIGQTASAPATLTVLGSPSIETSPNYVTGLPGMPLTVSAAVVGIEPISYQWQLNGQNLVDGGRITGSASAQLAVNSLQYADAGDYSLVASNAAGTVTGLVMQLSVTPIIPWGDNAYGQLRVPAQTANVVAISAGDSHSLALLADGTAVGWGNNSSGQANIPPSATNLVALAAGGAHSLALSAGGGVVAWGENSYGQSAVPARAANAVAIAAGDSHSLALLGDGTVVAWGKNNSGQTNTPAAATNVVAIAAGDHFSLALRSDGTLVPWGSVISSNEIARIGAGSGHRLALQANGEVLAWGQGYYGQTTVPPSAIGALAIAAGGDHSLALGSSGQVLAWGANYRGQADSPIHATNVVAISAGGAHSLALRGIEGQPLSVESAPRAATLGDEAVLLTTTSGVRGTTYQWLHNGMNIPGATNTSLLLTTTHWTNAGTYRVIVSNVFGSVTGPPMILTVLRTPLRFDTATVGVETTNNGFRARLLGASGVGSVVIYASTNLQVWEPFFTNPPLIGSLDLTDPVLASRTQRFYRAAEITIPSPVRLEVIPQPQPAKSDMFPLRVTGLSALGPVTIYASTNLIHWQAFFTNPPTIGPLDYWDWLPADQPQRFYRATESR